MKSKEYKTIYLDYSANTYLDNYVLSKMLPYFDKKYNNPSSLHSSGRRSGMIINQCKDKIANILNCNRNEIIFTGSGTESDNLAILGIARAYKEYGNHIIVSKIEHKAVLESVKILEKEGFIIDYLSVNKDGLIKFEELRRLINKKTILISIIYANNEIGTIQDIPKIADYINKIKYKNNSQFPIFHTDACQASEYLSLNVNELGIDLMTLNGAKIYGPKGIGILYKKNNLKLNPIIVGGEQENNLRAGSENLPAIVGFTEALILSEKRKEKESKRLIKLRDYFILELKRRIPRLMINGSIKYRLSNNINISIPNIEGESILLMLDNYGIEASTGSACSAYDLKPSHVLLAIGQTSEIAHGSIRFSLGRDTVKADLDYVLNILPNIVEKLLNISSLTIKRYEKKD